MLRKELGALADRPAIGGKSAEELRKEHAELDAIRPLLKQLLPLQDIPEDTRTLEQQKKIERLRHQIREIEVGGNRHEGPHPRTLARPLGNCAWRFAIPRRASASVNGIRSRAPSGRHRLSAAG